MGISLIYTKNDIVLYNRRIEIRFLEDAKMKFCPENGTRREEAALAEYRYGTHGLPLRHSLSVATAVTRCRGFQRVPFLECS